MRATNAIGKGPPSTAIVMATPVAALPLVFDTSIIPAPAPAYTYNVGSTVTLSLPPATGGTGDLNYTLTPKEDIPRGLTFTTATRTLAGTPNTAMTTVTLTYRVTDSADSPTTAELTFMVTVNKGEQTSFVFPDATVNKIIEEDSSTFTVTVTGGSGDGAVTYESDDTAVATVDNSGEVTIKTIGRTTITATKATDANYNEATAFYILTVNPAPLVFDTSMIPTPASAYIYNVGSTVTLSLPPATGGTGDLNYTLTPEKDIPLGLEFTTATRTLAGTPTAAMAAVTLTYTVTDRATSDTAALSFMVTVNKGEQTSFVFANTKVIRSVGDPNFILAPMGGSGDGAVTYESDDTAVATVDNSGEVIIKAIGRTTITATKATDANYNEATAFYILTVNPAPLIFDTSMIPTPASAYIYNVGSTVTLSLPPATGGTGVLHYDLTPIPNGLRFTTDTTPMLTGTPNTAMTTVTLTYRVTDSADSPTTAELTFMVTVNKGEQTSFVFPDATVNKIIEEDSSTFTVTVTGGSGDGAVTYKSDDPAVATVDNSGEVIIKTIGTTTITATKAADANYNEATAFYILTVANAGAFITTWQISPGSVANRTITIPIHEDSSYRYTVNWGEGPEDTTIYTNTIPATYTYPDTVTATSYKVAITGEFPRIYFNNGDDKDKIISIDQWGSNRWDSMESAFFGCSNLGYTAKDTPDLSQVTDMSHMFQGAALFNGDIGGWDVSNVADMSNMFANAALFNGNIGDWEDKVGQVTDMSFMFQSAFAFNQNISQWEVNNVTDMSFMFESALAFDQNISQWEVDKVTDMNSMFSGATEFNQDIRLLGSRQRYRYELHV